MNKIASSVNEIVRNIGAYFSIYQLLTVLCEKVGTESEAKSEWASERERERQIARKQLSRHSILLSMTMAMMTKQWSGLEHFHISMTSIKNQEEHSLLRWNSTSTATTRKLVTNCIYLDEPLPQWLDSIVIVGVAVSIFLLLLLWLCVYRILNEYFTLELRR